jgi:hypothetical protein
MEYFSVIVELYSCTTLTNYEPQKKAPPPLDQLLHLLLQHPPPPDMLCLGHPLLLLCIDVACSANKRGDKKKHQRRLSSHATVTRFMLMKSVGCRTGGEWAERTTSTGAHLLSLSLFYAYLQINNCYSATPRNT